MGDARIKLSLPVSPEPTDDELLFVRQLGVRHVYTWVGDNQTDYEFLSRLRARVEAAGLTLYNAGNMGVAKCDRIHLGLPGRDEAIERFQRFVTNLGRAGIHVTTFTWEPTGVWSSGPGQTRGAPTRHVDLAEMRTCPPTHGREYTRDEIWANYEYFIRAMMPVAERAGVSLALHPNDPPAESLGGIPCLVHSRADYERAFELAGSPYLGMEFCVGCWLEGGRAFGDLLEGIRTFQEQGRILIVHFRNVSAPLPCFDETFLDNGYMGMYEVMRVLCEAGYAGTITPDHTPRFAASVGTGAGAAYAIGYMRALIERAQVLRNTPVSGSSGFPA